jgi:hydrogenase nickel incorporation protein HypA/HybF
MHEASIAESIVRSVLRAAESAGVEKVESVALEFGEWSAFEPGQVEFWIRVGFENTPARDASLEFSVVPGRIRCRSCGTEGPCPRPKDGFDHYVGPILQCPACGGPDVEIVSGREARVKSIRASGAASAPPEK